jgi:chromate transporter
MNHVIAQVPSSAPAKGGEELVYAAIPRFVLYFLRLGAAGFGGPIALVGHMQRDLVEKRRWVSRQDYVEGLAFSQLCPGPLAAQLAIYLGWVRAGIAGATLAGVAFVLPSFIMVLALSALYIGFGGLPWMQGAFYGIGAAVIAVIGRSAVRLMKLVLGRDWLLWSIFVISFGITVWTESELLLLFVVCGFASLMIRARPRLIGGTHVFAVAPCLSWLITGIRGPASPDTLWKICWYFAEAGAFVFGSGLAIIPFLHAGVVQQFQWLDDRQFLDAVAVAMITPGPVVITAGFVGYLAAGPVGATVAAISVFLPPYLLVVLLAPYYRAFAQNRQIKAFVAGVTAATTGAIAAATVILGKHAIVDLPTALIAAATIVALIWARKIPEPLVILAAGAVGLFLK